MRPQNIGRACGMPLLQVQTCCPSLVLNFHNRSNAVLSRCTPIMAICEWKRGPRARARATITTNSQLETYCCVPRERRVWGVLVVLLRVSPYASPVTLDLVVKSVPSSSPSRSSACPAQSPLPSCLAEGSPRCLYPSTGEDRVVPSSSNPSLVFQPPIPRLQVHSWHHPVPQLSFWPGSPLCRDQKGCFARKGAVK